eukprot:COSAG04_NODE_40_length_33185_cov_14.524663_24_plen_417_part_00
MEGQAAAAADEVAEALGRPLPDGWDAAVRRDTGTLFYVNTLTGETQDCLPASAAECASPEIVALPEPEPEPEPLPEPEPEPEPEPDEAHFLPVSPRSSTSYDQDDEMDRSVGAQPWIEPSCAPSAGELEGGAASAARLEAEGFLEGLGGRSPAGADDERTAARLSQALVAAGKECLCVAGTEAEFSAVLDLFNTALRLTPEHPKLPQLIGDASEASTFALYSGRAQGPAQDGDEQGVEGEAELPPPPPPSAEEAEAEEGAVIASLKVCAVPRELLQVGALHCRLMLGTGADATELYDSRATPPDGGVSSNTEEQARFGEAATAVLSFAADIRVPPPPATLSLILYHTPDGSRSDGKLAPLLSGRLGAALLAEEATGGGQRSVRLGSSQLTRALGQQEGGIEELDAMWVELICIKNA